MVEFWSHSFIIQRILYTTLAVLLSAPQITITSQDLGITVKNCNPKISFEIRKAAREGQKNEVTSLLQNKEICRDDANNYLIRESSAMGWTDIVEQLLKESETNPQIDPSANFNYAIKWASAGGHTDVVKLLLQDKRVDPAAESNFAIRWASENGFLDVVKVLLQDKRVDPSDGNNYAIRYASENGFLDVVKVLLQDKRVDLSTKNNYAIRSASDRGFVDIVKLLMQDKRVDPYANYNEAIQYSSRYGHTDVVKLLLQDDVNGKWGDVDTFMLHEPWLQRRADDEVVFVRHTIQLPRISTNVSDLR